MKANQNIALLNVTQAAAICYESAGHLKAAVKAAVSALTKEYPKCKTEGHDDAKALRTAIIDAALAALTEKAQASEEGKNLRQTVSIYLSQDCGIRVRGERGDKGKTKDTTEDESGESGSKMPLTEAAIVRLIKAFAAKKGKEVSDVYAAIGDKLGC